MAKQKTPVAITFDDLPATSITGNLKNLKYINSNLLRKPNKEGIITIGFVNEGRTHGSGELDERTEI